MQAKHWIIIAIILSVVSLFGWQELRHSQRVERMENDYAALSRSADRLTLDNQRLQIDLLTCREAELTSRAAVAEFKAGVNAGQQEIEGKVSTYTRSFQKKMVRAVLAGKPQPVPDRRAVEVEPVARADTGRFCYSASEHASIVAGLVMGEKLRDTLALMAGDNASLVLKNTVLESDQAALSQALATSTVCHRWIFCPCKRLARKEMRRLRRNALTRSD